MADLRLDNVRKVYRGRRGTTVEAVKDLSLDIRDGEFIAFLGPSGCGKTSTLRMIAGLESITGGTISLGGHVINDLDASQRDVAMAFESYALYPPLTVRENLAFPLRARNTPRAEIDRRVAEVAEMLSISPILDLKPAQLSGGEQQRVSLGRAVVRKPSLFLLDEPLSHVEPRLRFQTRSQLKELITRFHTATVYVTHDQLDAVALADRIAVMNDGVIQQLGTPAELFDQPANTFVAGFVGEPPINLIACHPREEDQARLLVSDEGDFRITITPAIWQAIQPAVHASVQVGIRPYDLMIEPEVAPLGHSTISGGRVVLSEWLGDEWHVTVEVGAQQLIAVAPPSYHPRDGEIVTLALPGHSVHVFDAESGVLLNLAA